MLGFMAVSEMTSETKSKYDIIAESDGLVAALPIGELKQESRRNPQPVFFNFYSIVFQNSKFSCQKVLRSTPL